MTMGDILQAVQFVEAKGKRFAIFDIETWESLRKSLEKPEDTQIESFGKTENILLEDAMTEVVSLLHSNHSIKTLEELLPLVEHLHTSDKLRLLRILSEQLDSNETIALLEPNTTYSLPTPYDSFGAADILLQLLQEEQEDV